MAAFKKCLFLGLLLFGGIAFPAFSQDYPRQNLDFELFVQELFNQQEEDDVPYEDIYETLFQYYQNPINLNRTNREELSTIFILSPAQINNFLQHIEKNGKLLSVYELQSIEGFDLITIYKLMPFVMVPDAGLSADARPLYERIIGEDNNALILRYERTLQEKVGYTEPTFDNEGNPSSRYAGSPVKLIARYRVSHTRDFSLGFTAEKDAGEKFTWDPDTKRYGFDYYSAHFQVYDKGKFKTLAIGDYQLQIGQGLLFSSGYGVGKGSETINTVKRSTLGIRPYSSVLESTFYRGAAATYSLNKFDVTAFYSRKKIDGNVQAIQDSLAELENFSESFGGVQVSGFHRTPSEIASKHAIQEQIMGSTVTYRSIDRNLVIGASVLQTLYDKPLQRDQAPYTAFEFSGTRNLNLGVHYTYNWQNFNFFGETARSSSGGIGTVNGFMANLSNKAELAMVYRNYQRNFHTFYGSAFGESTRNINEKGVYAGVKLRPHSKWEITAFYDRFQFPWLRYRVDAPSAGDEYLVRLLYKPNKQSSVYAQFRTETKDRNDPDATAVIDYVSQTLRRNYLVYYDYSPTPLINFRSRVQFSSFEQGTGPQTTGYIIAQDVNFNFGKLRLSTRYAVFDTDDYETRLYVNEKDVLYAFAIPVFSGRGTRMYALLQYRVNRNMDVWFKIGHTHYRDQEFVSSGLEEIEGPLKTDVRAQVKYQF